MSQSWENLRTDGRTDGRTIFYRTLPAEAGSQIKQKEDLNCNTKSKIADYTKSQLEKFLWEIFQQNDEANLF